MRVGQRWDTSLNIDCLTGKQTTRQPICELCHLITISSVVIIRSMLIAQRHVKDILRYSSLSYFFDVSRFSELTFTHCPVAHWKYLFLLCSCLNASLIRCFGNKARLGSINQVPQTFSSKSPTDLGIWKSLARNLTITIH